MRKRRRKQRLGDKATLVIASLFLAVNVMVRDPQAAPEPPPHGDVALMITMILMAFGLCVAFYGLYYERHKLYAHMAHRLEVRLRFVRMAYYSPGLRRAVSGA